MFYSYVYQKVEQTTITSSELPPEPRNLKKRKEASRLAEALQQGCRRPQAPQITRDKAAIPQRVLKDRQVTSQRKQHTGGNAVRRQERLVKDILPVVDALDRAVDYVEGESKEGQFQGVLNGLRLVQKMFLNQLEKNQVVSFDSEGELFDPSQHEAIESKYSEDIEAGNVVSEYQRGFFMDGNLLRPSLVTVSLGTQAQEQQSAD